MTQTTELTPELKDAIDEMVQRRMKNTNETEEVAAEHILKVFDGLVDMMKPLEEEVKK